MRRVAVGVGWVDAAPRAWPDRRRAWLHLAALTGLAPCLTMRANPMQPSAADLRDLEQSRHHPGKGFKALCYAPWTQLAFWPDGDVTVCCASQPQPVGNIQDRRLPEIWRGAGIAAYRQQLRRYEFPPGCVVCHNDLAAGRRHALVLRDFDNGAVALEPAWPSRMEFSLSNTCNLTCVMCSGKLSSGIRVHEGLPPLPKVYTEQFFSDLAPFLPHLQMAAFKGGEPFLEAECKRIWEMLIAAELTPRCHITTNGSIWNERVERVLHELPCDLAISIDGVSPAVVERIRLNNRFDELMANVKRFQAFVTGSSDKHHDKRRRNLTLNYTVQRLNWFETADFFLFAEGLGAEVWYALVHGPDHCSLLTLPADELAKIFRKMSEQTARIEPHLVVNRARWHELLAELQSWMAAKDRGQEPSVMTAKVETPMQRAFAHYTRGELPQAIAAARSIPPGEAEHANGLAFAGGILTDRGELADAETCLLAARTADPTLVEPPLRLAWIGVVKLDYDAARQELAVAKELARAVGALPVEATRGMLFVEACIHARTGAPQLAVPLLERLLASDPDHAGARELYRAAKAQCG